MEFAVFENIYPFIFLRDHIKTKITFIYITEKEILMALACEYKDYGGSKSCLTAN